MLSRAMDAFFGLHFYETALSPGEPVFFTEQLRDAVRLLDEELHYVITTHGWPTLEMPSRRLHKFGVHSLVDCARIDFYRCGGGDDIPNTRWAAWFPLLPKYQSLIKVCYGEVTDESTAGNCMETVVGISAGCTS